MSSQARVKNSVRGGVDVYPPAPWADTPLGRHPPWAEPPYQMATAAEGTHPTGMHSCFEELFNGYVHLCNLPMENIDLAHKVKHKPSRRQLLSFQNPMWRVVLP